MTASQFMKLLIHIDKNGNIRLKAGTPAASASAAEVPTGLSGTLPIGFIVVSTDASNNVANITPSDIYQFVAGGGSGGGGAVRTITTLTSSSGYTATADDDLVIYSAASAGTMYLPLLNSVDIGTQITFKCLGKPLTVTAQDSSSIDQKLTSLELRNDGREMTFTAQPTTIGGTTATWWELTGNTDRPTLRGIDVISTTEGSTPMPHMTESERNAVTIGNNIYNTDRAKPQYNDGSIWRDFSNPFIYNSYTGAATLDEDECALVDSSGGAFTLTLPSIPLNAKGIRVRIIDAGHNFGTNNVTIVPAGGQTIYGGANLILNTTDGNVELVSNGTNWEVLALG